jgi:hypothetical protein
MSNKMMSGLIGMLALVSVSACGTVSKTQMVAAADYGAARRLYVVPSPSPLLVGPDTVRTYSPDSTVFVCPDGTVRDASKVSSGSKPACL